MERVRERERGRKRELSSERNYPVEINTTDYDKAKLKNNIDKNIIYKRLNNFNAYSY